MSRLSVKVLPTPEEVERTKFIREQEAKQVARVLRLGEFEKEAANKTPVTLETVNRKLDFIIDILNGNV